MFDEGNNLFGGSAGDVFENARQGGAEQAVPALPAPGQGHLQGDGSGNYQAPMRGAAPMQQAAPPQGAIVVPLVGGGGSQVALPPGAQPQNGWTWQGMEPHDTSPQAATRSAGFSALLVAALGGIGLAVGGPWGAIAGVLTASALSNGYRAQKWFDSADPSEKHEAVVSGVFTAGAVGVGAYAAYKAYQAKQEDEGGGGKALSKNRKHKKKWPAEDDEEDDETGDEDEE